MSICIMHNEYLHFKVIFLKKIQKKQERKSRNQHHSLSSTVLFELPNSCQVNTYASIQIWSCTTVFGVESDWGENLSSATRQESNSTATVPESNCNAQLTLKAPSAAVGAVLWLLAHAGFSVE